VLSWAERYEGGRAWRPSRFLEELGEDVVRRDLRIEGPNRSTGEPALGQPVRSTPRAPDAAVPTLSFSAIRAYRECPRQHWYRYQLRLPAPPVVEAQFGVVLHQALMRAGQLRREGHELDRELLRDLYQGAWETVSLVEPRRRPALEALGWRLLERFFDAGGLQAQPRVVESAFAVELDGWTLRGVIDRVDEPQGGGAAWRIIDYKTGSPVPASRLRRDLQLALYALGARTALRLDPIELEIVYLKDGRRVTVPAGQDLLDEAGRIGAEVAEAVRAGRFEARPQRRRCSLCAYRLSCDAALQ
jgi:RecB family exonuclease